MVAVVLRTRFPPLSNRKSCQLFTSSQGVRGVEIPSNSDRMTDGGSSGGFHSHRKRSSERSNRGANKRETWERKGFQWNPSVSQAFPERRFDAPLPLFYLLLTSALYIHLHVNLSPPPSPFPLREQKTCTHRVGQRMLFALPRKTPLADEQMTSSYYLNHFILFNDRVLIYRFQRKKSVAMSGKKIWRCFVFSCILPQQLRSSKRGSTTTKK